MIPNEVKDFMRLILLFAMKNSKKIAILIFMIIIALASWLYLPFDNQIEEFAEDQIEEVIGFRIDLSPTESQDAPFLNR